MTTTHTANYTEVVKICTQIACDFRTIVEVKNYPEYRWASICFMTDKFGGVYSILHFSHDTNVLTLNYGSKGERIINTEEELRMIVNQQRKAMLKARNFDDLADFLHAYCD